MLRGQDESDINPSPIDVETRIFASPLALTPGEEYLNPGHTSKAHGQIIVERRLPTRDDYGKHPRCCGRARRPPPSRPGGAAHNDVRLSRPGLSGHVEPALRQRVVFSRPSTFVQTPRDSFALRLRRAGPRPEATVVDDQGPLVVAKPPAKLFEQRRIPSSHDDQSSGSLHRRRIARTRCATGRMPE